MNKCTVPRSYRVVSRLMFRWLVLMPILLIWSVQCLQAQDAHSPDYIADKLKTALETGDVSKIADLGRDAANSGIPPAEFQAMIKKNNPKYLEWKANCEFSGTENRKAELFLHDFDKILTEKRVDVRRNAYKKLVKEFLENQIQRPPPKDAKLREKVTNALPGQLGAVTQAVIKFGEAVKQGMIEIDALKKEREEMELVVKLEAIRRSQLETDVSEMEAKLDKYLADFNKQYNAQIKQNMKKKLEKEKQEHEKLEQEKKDAEKAEKENAKNKAKALAELAKLEKLLKDLEATKGKPSQNSTSSGTIETKGSVWDKTSKITLTEETDSNGHKTFVYTTTDKDGKVLTKTTYDGIKTVVKDLQKDIVKQTIRPPRPVIVRPPACDGTGPNCKP